MAILFYSAAAVPTAPWTDTFDDLDNWTIVDNGASADTSIVSGAMRMTADAGTDNCKATLNYELSGDYEIQVDYNMVQTQGSTGWGAFFYVQIDSNWYLQISRSYSPYGNAIMCDGNKNGVYTFVGTNSALDTGKFKIVRSGTTITMSSWTGSAWDVVGSPVTGWVTSNMYTYLSNSYFTSRPGTITVDWDNFIINSGTVVLP